ncbi:MAG: nucleotidyltransferase family protein [Candidatus Kaelpia aquatica]|nr:nucleotidyltransferase family protein [Candidatus Kaelpia aquatica]
MKENIEAIKQKILPILQNYGVKKVALFGSSVRDEMKENSDIDILIDIKSDVSLLGFVELKQKLEETLERKVDLVEYDTLKPILRERILKEQVVLL